MSTDNEILDINKDLRKLSRIYKQRNIHVGISSRFDNLFELQKHYNEAVLALTVGLENNGRQQVFQYDEKSFLSSNG